MADSSLLNLTYGSGYRAPPKKHNGAYKASKRVSGLLKGRVICIFAGIILLRPPLTDEVSPMTRKIADMETCVEPP